MRTPLQRRDRAYKTGRAQAFTRTELLAALVALTLLALVVLPLTANSPLLKLGARERSKRLVCVANLRQIGEAFQLWASDHGDQNPSFVRTNAGGIYGVLLANNVWYQFAWVSNELATPRVLVCPSDTNNRRVAHDFSSNFEGGFLHPTYRNNAVSYLLSMHAFYYVRSVLSGDRNVSPITGGVACSYSGLSSIVALQPNAAWTTDVHGSSGNLLFNDGSVQESTTRDLQQALPQPGDVPTSFHMVLPP